MRKVGLFSGRVFVRISDTGKSQEANNASTYRKYNGGFAQAEEIGMVPAAFFCSPRILRRLVVSFLSRLRAKRRKVAKFSGAWPVCPTLVLAKAQIQRLVQLILYGPKPANARANRTTL